MKILRFDKDRIGIIKNDNLVVDVSELIQNRDIKGPQRVIEEVILNFDDLREDIEKLMNKDKGVSVDDIEILVPIPRPGKCIGAFLNYLDLGRTVDMLPLEFFYKDNTLLGPGGIINLIDVPEVTEFQPEAELAFVMKKSAKDLSVEDAMDHVFGYVPFFDISVRGITRYTRFLTKGQATHGPCGPWIVTKDEIPNPHSLNVKSWVNGEIAQNYSTENMAHKIPNLVAWASRFVELHTADVIATGTFHEGRKPISDGDFLEIEIEGIGKTGFHAKGFKSIHGTSEPTPGSGPAPALGVKDSSKITRI
ncbi:MAG: fumarylacetoacetate hydrolase family protein [Nitrospinota bacterium]|nr:fumarylacetoacetate hydrolase family protein [Nitrospinota bacterium]